MHNYGILGTLTQVHHERQAPRGCGTAPGAVAKEVWSHCARGALVHQSTWSYCACGTPWSTCAPQHLVILYLWSTMKHLDNLYLWSTMEHLLWSTLWHSDIIRWFGYITRKTVLRCSFQGQGRCGYVVIQLGTWKLFAGLTISNLFHTTNDHQQRRNEYQEL